MLLANCVVASCGTPSVYLNTLQSVPRWRLALHPDANLVLLSDLTQIELTLICTTQFLMNAPSPGPLVFVSDLACSFLLSVKFEDTLNRLPKSYLYYTGYNLSPSNRFCYFERPK